MNLSKQGPARCRRQPSKTSYSQPTCVPHSMQRKSPAAFRLTRNDTVAAGYATAAGGRPAAGVRPSTAATRKRRAQAQRLHGLCSDHQNHRPPCRPDPVLEPGILIRSGGRGPSVRQASVDGWPDPSLRNGGRSRSELVNPRLSIHACRSTPPSSSSRFCSAALINRLAHRRTTCL